MLARNRTFQLRMKYQLTPLSSYPCPPITHFATPCLNCSYPGRDRPSPGPLLLPVTSPRTNQRDTLAHTNTPDPTPAKTYAPNTTHPALSVRFTQEMGSPMYLPSLRVRVSSGVSFRASLRCVLIVHKCAEAWSLAYAQESNARFSVGMCSKKRGSLIHISLLSAPKVHA